MVRRERAALLVELLTEEPPPKSLRDFERFLRQSFFRARTKERFLADGKRGPLVCGRRAGWRSSFRNKEKRAIPRRMFKGRRH